MCELFRAVKQKIAYKMIFNDMKSKLRRITETRKKLKCFSDVAVDFILFNYCFCCCNFPR